mmetsp:Transcript_15553/g.23166  ORF Transcript_15553/g.23166 Transcript_15553/m.23166 type:complete len:175 (-) Transcript_15553:116-640(-)
MGDDSTVPSDNGVYIAKVSRITKLPSQINSSQSNNSQSNPVFQDNSPANAVERNPSDVKIQLPISSNKTNASHTGGDLLGISSYSDDFSSAQNPHFSQSNVATPSDDLLSMFNSPMPPSQDSKDANIGAKQFMNYMPNTTPNPSLRSNLPEQKNSSSPKPNKSWEHQQLDHFRL